MARYKGSDLMGIAMQRDMDYVRDLLLRIEAVDSKPPMKDLLSESATQQDLDKLTYHMEMLVEEAGFVTGIPAHMLIGKNWLDLKLTWHGHEFLNAIRDQTIWDKTKAGANKVGNWSIGFLTDAAKAYAKLKAKEMLGIEI